MQHYYSAERIMKRLDIHAKKTLYHWITHKGLPVYKRHYGAFLHPRLYTNDALLLAWEVTMAKSFRDTLKGSRPPPPAPPAVSNGSEIDHGQVVD